MPDLLIEFGCEELPSSACREAIAQAPGLLDAALANLHLSAGASVTWVAPRRIAVFSGGVAERQGGGTRSVRGPAASAAFDPEGAPTAAAHGFARGQGADVAQLVVREDPDAGRDFIWFDRPGDDAPLEDLVAEIAGRVLEGLRFGKTMRWGEGRGLRFSRPVRWITAMVDSRPVQFGIHGIPAGGSSRGHRFLGGPVAVSSAGAYRDDLRASFVISDHEERRAAILAGLDAAAAALGGTWSDPAGKIEEVVHLVEWPGVIAGRIAAGHLGLPERVLVTAMQSHQRYMPIHDADGGLMPMFLAVSNGDPSAAEIIVRGNEDVLDARLKDAAFSYERDVAAGLDALGARLGSIVFHARLGTLADKRDRLMGGVRDLGTSTGAADDVVLAAEAAAALAKADQGAILVAEFSELQGFAAAHYAERAGHPPAVVDAIAEQYLPEGADSPSPATEAGALLACAEKVDNLAGAFLIGEIPSGSKDPYGLRRAAAGLVRIALERGWSLRPRDVLVSSLARFRSQGADAVLSDEEALGALVPFIGDRLVHHLGQEGVSPDAVRAAMGADPGGLAVTAAWARALHAHRDDSAVVRAAAGANRCRRIVAGDAHGLGGFASLGDPDEDALAAALAVAENSIATARAAGDPGAALAAAGALTGPLNGFFEAVMVNADDLSARERRHALVRRAGEAYGRVADFEVLVLGGGE